METKAKDTYVIAGKLLSGRVKAMAKSSKPLSMEYRLAFVADLKTGKTVIKVIDPSGKLIGIIDQFPDLPS
jgi:hypothetical protein